MNNVTGAEKKNFTSTRNACALCAPLGAALAFRGIENCIPLIHGSQGCSTYIRRYIISHFREPVDIASSNFSEESAIFGGSGNLKSALDNVIRQYRPSLVGVASTCLSETIGDDVPRALREYCAEGRGGDTPVVQVSTPSYRGTHAEGFRAAVRSSVEALAVDGERHDGVNFFTPVISPEDIRHLKDVISDFGISGTVLPDYSESMDGSTWESYKKLPEGGTPVSSIKAMGGASSSVDIGISLNPEVSAGKYLSQKFAHSFHSAALPLGITACDSFFKILSELSGRKIPERYIREKGRLADAYIDAHKYLSGKRAVVCGDPDMVSGVAAFLEETGVKPVLCATGSRGMSAGFSSSLPGIPGVGCSIVDDTDFTTILEMCAELRPDIIIGSSKAFYLSKNLGIPLVRAGFPIHDRFGGQRLMHVGYRGTMQLFDRIVNAVMEHKQSSSKIGYSYI